MTKHSILDLVLEGLMRRYTERVPDVATILDAMVSKDVIENPAQIENDHIAFRTLGIPNLGIQSLEKIFLHYGYQKKDHYYFEEKKLDAFWYAPPYDKYPRVFISELRVTELSQQAQQIIHRYTSTIELDPVDALNLDDAVAVDTFLHSPLWSTPSLEDYETLARESEYASWVIYNRYYLNHFTISVHNLPEGFNTLENFNHFLEAQGIVLNDAGGKIKTSPDGGLRQSATVAKKVLARFSGGEELQIPGSYVEFAERSILPEFAGLPLSQIKRQHRREGFEAANANKIFESTYQAQTGK